MKTIVLASTSLVLSLLAPPVFAQITLSAPPATELAATEPTVVARDYNSCAWQWTVPKLWPDGQIIAEVHGYVELNVGGWYQDATGQWLATEERFELLADGAAAIHGPHSLVLAGNLNTRGAIDLFTPEGKRFTINIIGLAYVDAASGQSAVLSVTKDCVGELTAPNQVVYPDAFSDVSASVRITYSRLGFEQDVLIEQDLPPPEAFSLQNDTTRLEIWSELVNAPLPANWATVAGGGSPPASPGELVSPGLDVELLDFGVMQIRAGSVFPAETDPDQPPVPAGARWLQQPDGRRFLLESVPYSAVKTSLQTLKEARAPSREQTAKLQSPGPPSRSLVVRHFPPPPPARTKKQPMRLAKARPVGKALVADYQVLNSGLSNYVFASDTTYYLSAATNVTLNGTSTVFEGGTVIKATNGASLWVQSGTVDFQGTPYHPIILTARDDRTVGEAIPGATNNPATNCYANPALRITTGLSNWLQNLRIRYAALGLECTGTNNVLTHAQLLKVQNGFQAYTNGSAAAQLRNVLAAGISNLFVGSNLTVSAEHLTLANANYLVVSNASLTNKYLTNSLLVAVTNASGYTGANNQTVSDITGVFQTVGAGQFYLVTTSPYLGAGTTNINTQLLADLAQRTVFPPVLLSNVVFNINTVLGPLAQRDTGAQTLGYHYDPLDYLMTGVKVTNATVTLTNGAAVGVDCTVSNGIAVTLQGSGIFLSQGSALSLNHIVRLHSVQEQAVTNGSLAYAIFGEAAYATNSALRCRFTDLAQMAGGYYHYIGANYLGGMELAHSQLRGGRLCCYGSASAFVYPLYGWTNNVFERTTVSFTASANQGVAFYPINNLFIRGNLCFVITSSYFYSYMQNNLFDNLSITASNSTPNNGYDAYINTPVLQNSYGHDVSTNIFTYDIGLLGRYYQPTNSPFINAGSTSATNLGLYHFTTTTNQLKETNSVVDIGLHYVACNTNGLPVDSDSDGTPDYVRDANGNGSVNSGESNWNDANDPGLRVWILRPRPPTQLP